MSQAEPKTKCVAKCSNCGDVYPSEVGPDGTIQPIGVAGCKCGDGDLHRLDA